MTNTQSAIEQSACPNYSGVLQLLEAQTQIQFHLPKGGVSFRPGILQMLEADTQIQFQLHSESKLQSVAIVESLTGPMTVRNLQVAYC